LYVCDVNIEKKIPIKAKRPEVAKKIENKSNNPYLLIDLSRTNE
jgi:hypothetical protein